MKSFLRLLILSASFCIATTTAGAQIASYEVPEDYTLEAAEDYKRYEKDVIATADWLEATPSTTAVRKRKEAARFIVAWTAGSPDVSIEVFNGVTDLMKENEDMLVLYLAFCARWTLQNNMSQDTAAQQRAALRAMVAVYNRGGDGITRTRAFDRLAKAAKTDAALDEWIQKGKTE